MKKVPFKINNQIRSNVDNSDGMMEHIFHTTYGDIQSNTLSIIRPIIDQISFEIYKLMYDKMLMK
jgi:hypothetical protein